MSEDERRSADERRGPGDDPLFARGSYTPIPVVGEFADCVVAFERKLEDTSFVVVVPRLASRVGFPPLGDLWQASYMSP